MGIFRHPRRKQMVKGAGARVSRRNVDCRESPAYDSVDMCFRFHLIAIVLAFVPASLAQPNRCEVLPSDARLVIEQRFPNWRPKVLSDLSGYDKTLWLKTHPKDCPGIAVGHFEQVDRLAYAVLLVPKSGHTASYKVVVLSKAADEYAVRLLDHADGTTYSDSGLIISKESHGTYSGFDETKSVHLKVDGVNVEWLEKSSVLYYWSGGKYRSLQTSD